MAWPVVATFGPLFKLTVEGRIHGQVSNNVLWFHNMAELGADDVLAEMNDLADAFIPCVTDNLLAGLSQQWALERVRVQHMDTPNKQEIIVNAPPGSVGALGDAVPSTDAIDVSWRTPYTGKSHRGRSYMSGIPEANQLSSQIIGVTLVAAQNYAQAVIDNFGYPNGTNQRRFVIFSRKTGFVKPSTYTGGADNTTPVNRYIVDPVVATMRSRRVGRGV
jgi:hypothetical protein